MLPESFELFDITRIERDLGVALPPAFRDILQGADTYDRYKVQWVDGLSIKDGLKYPPGHEIRELHLKPIEDDLVGMTLWLRREPLVGVGDGPKAVLPNAWIWFGREISGDLFFLDTAAAPYWIMRWDHETRRVKQMIPLSKALDADVGL